MVPDLNVGAERENVVISVMDVARLTYNQKTVTAYYSLICKVTEHFSQTGVPVTLVSLCESDGDGAAVQRVMEELSDTNGVSTCFYQGDTQAILELFAKASFVVASRFHSLIFALSFGKPVFPVVYSCKTAHYLQDLQFAGKYADFASLPDTDCADVLYNYEKNIVTDCREHKCFAENQFWALREHLKR